jgi:hypothetical protein
VSWIRRAGRSAPKAGGSPQDRLSDLEFLALVREALETIAPRVTKGATLKGSSLVSPRGWVLGMAPPHRDGHHYDVVVFPEVDTSPGAGYQDGLPCFLDCAVAATGDPRDAAMAWALTAGSCFLELVDQRGRFAEHVGPDEERGVPGFHAIASAEAGYGLDQGELDRLQEALHEANVLHRIVDVLAPELESPYFNGIKLFYGGKPGAMQCEVRINGERDEAASAAMAALGLPEPTVFTAVRAFALLVPMTADGDEPGYSVKTELYSESDTDTDTDDDSDSHADSCACHGADCECGGRIDPEHPGFAIELPYLVQELSPAERAERIQVDTGAMMVVKGEGNFLKVRLPIQLEDGRTLVYLAWVVLRAEDIEEVIRRVHDGTLPGHRFPGLFCNIIEPWGKTLLRASVTVEGRQPSQPGTVGIPEIVASTDHALKKVLAKRWPAEVVLGDRDPRLRVG